MKTLHKKHTNIASTALAAVLCTFSAIAVHAQVPVNDSTVRSNTNKIAGEAAQINDSTRQMNNSVQEIQQTIGVAGNNPSPLSGTLSSAVGTGSEFYQNMQEFGYDMCAVTLCENDDPVGTKDIEEAREWAMTNFFTSGQDSNDPDLAGRALEEPVRRDLIEIRRRGLAYATTNSLALAVTIHEELAGADGTANALESKIAEAPNMRADIQANSAIALAQYEVALQQLAVLNSALVVESMVGINSAGIYHEEGGSKFGDALIDDDFSDPGFSVRTRVTPPEKNSSGGMLDLLP